MAFLTDYQGNILDTAGRPALQLPGRPTAEVAVDDATDVGLWHGGAGQRCSSTRWRWRTSATVVCTFT
jgi:hypothetical protein